MLTSLRNMFKVPDLRNKILFVLLILALYRFGSYVPTPGIDFSAVQDMQELAAQGGALGFLRLFSGGALTRFAIFGLGIMPYITASIIMQVLAVVIPKLEQWREQGAVGQKKITQWTRYVTVALAVLQSTGLAFLFSTPGAGGMMGEGSTILLIPERTVPRLALVVLSLTAGTALLMWMGELITQRGIGNGMSLLIFASVVSVLPDEVTRIYSEHGVLTVTIAGIAVLAILVAIVFVEQGQRRIPVQFAKRVVGRRQYGGQSSYIPLKVNQSGVIPIIFASSVLYLPTLVTNVLPADWTGVRSWIERNLLDPASFFYIGVFGLMIIFFAYFYTAITFDPVKQADTIRKQGGFIPGIRPGPQTERHLAKILSRITLPGALFIAFIALIPSIALVIFEVEAFNGFGGISLLIAVGVALETMKQIDSQLMMRNYESFLK